MSKRAAKRRGMQDTVNEDHEEPEDDESQKEDLQHKKGTLSPKAAKARKVLQV